MSAKLHAQTHYQISFANLNAHLIEIDARFVPSTTTADVVHHPVWTPGSYLIREYAKNIEELAAYDDAGASLTVERMDKASWKVSHGGKPFHVKYRHYANELAVRNAHADPTHCFFTPAAILVYNPALAQQVHTIAIKLPQTWTTISTSLPSKDGIYTAPNLDELMDSPFEIGSHQEQTFDMDGVRYRMATYPAARRFTDAHLADVRDVVHQANQVFAPEPPPIKEYLFITHLNNGGGGLEHKFGSVLQGNVAILTDKKQFNGFLSLVAHEYFHLWNVKRIRPRRLGPFDYQQENYTTTLWFAEGVTSYYDDLIATRAGKYTPDEYLNTLAGGINNAGTIQGWRLQSLESASYDAWIKYYRPNENSQNATVNYYTQGSVVGWAMDMHIRALTKGAKNLDNLMLNLWKKAKDNADFYADRQAIAQAMTEVCGTDQAAWLEGLVAKPALPEIENLALGVGLLPIDHRKDKFWPSLGMGQQRAGDKIVVGAIYRGGPAEKAGVLVGDVLVKLEDKPLTEPYKEDELPYVEYQSVAVDILRQGEPIRLMLNVAPSPRMRWQLNMATKRSPLLQGWLDKK